jgi:hypothetical protein
MCVMGSQKHVRFVSGGRVVSRGEEKPEDRRRRMGVGGMVDLNSVGGKRVPSEKRTGDER